MNRTLRIAIGVATLWPLTYAMFFIGLGFFSFFFPAHAVRLDFLFFPLHFLTILWVWALLVFYAVNLFRSDRIQKDQKALWAVVLFMGNMIAMPIYWYLFIWRDAPLGVANRLGPVAGRTASEDQQHSAASKMPNWRE